MENIVSVPDGRIGMVVGKNGAVKREIEKLGAVRLTISEGFITIKGESLKVMSASNVVNAIGLGFQKKDAFELFNEEFQLMTYEIAESVPESQLPRIKGRIIGEKGKVKLHIEKSLEVHIIVGDDKIAAIGDPMRLQVLREVLERLLGGATHASAYKHLDRRLASLENL